MRHFLKLRTIMAGGIERPSKYLIYADEKLKSKIRTMLRKVMKGMKNK